eukprot:3163895-Prymnesium_polylepis.1
MWSWALKKAQLHKRVSAPDTHTRDDENFPTRNSHWSTVIAPPLASRPSTPARRTTPFTTTPPAASETAARRSSTAGGSRKPDDDITGTHILGSIPASPVSPKLRRTSGSSQHSAC